MNNSHDTKRSQARFWASERSTRESSDMAELTANVKEHFSTDKSSVPIQYTNFFSELRMFGKGMKRKDVMNTFRTDVCIISRRIYGGL